MPYIKEEDREVVILDGPHGPGELNYFLTTHVLTYLGDYPRYLEFNEVLGVLEAMKLELYRRMIAPYEDLKCKENGEVYP